MQSNSPLWLLSHNYCQMLQGYSSLCQSFSPLMYVCMYVLNPRFTLWQWNYRWHGRPIARSWTQRSPTCVHLNTWYVECEFLLIDLSASVSYKIFVKDLLDNRYWHIYQSLKTFGKMLLTSRSFCTICKPWILMKLKEIYNPLGNAEAFTPI